MKAKRIVIILSGGLDSTILTYYLKDQGYEIFALTFDYGQKHQREVYYAEHTCHKLKIPHKIINKGYMKYLIDEASALTSDKVNIPTLKQVIGEAQPITYVPFRNANLLMDAFTYAEAIGAEFICFGAQAHDEYSGYWDTTMEFVKRINAVAELNRKHQIRVVAPFVNLSKSEEIIIGQRLDVDFKTTMTCYRGEDCGKCPTCKDRITAFKRVGIIDPRYKDIKWDEEIKKHKKSYDIDEIKKKIVGF